MSGHPEVDDEPSDPTPSEATERVPPFVRVLARILVRLALEEEGVVEPKNDNTQPPW